MHTLNSVDLYLYICVKKPQRACNRRLTFTLNLLGRRSNRTDILLKWTTLVLGVEVEIKD